MVSRSGRAVAYPSWRSPTAGRGAGRRPRLRLVDRLVVTLAHLRLGVPHEALVVAFGVDRSTVTRAIGQVRPLLAGRGCVLACGVRLRSLADVFAYAAAVGVRLRVDATVVGVRRPGGGWAGRKAFVSGKPQAEHDQGHGGQ